MNGIGSLGQLCNGSLHKWTHHGALLWLETPKATLPTVEEIEKELENGR